MKTVRVLLMVALAWLALPASVSAFYNPSTGRWLNRDPIGTRGGPNEFAFTKNCPVCNVDRLGQQIVPPLFGPMCPYCICMSVEVEYKPGGKQLDLGFVVNYDAPGKNWPAWLWGTMVHVRWNVLGNPSLCSYFQDEGRMSGHATGPGGNIDFQGHDGNRRSQEYYDFSGFYPEAHGKGHYSDSVFWEVTFRCVSYPRSLPGKSRRDGPWTRSGEFDFPEDAY